MSNVPERARQAIEALWPVSRETWVRLEAYHTSLTKWQKRINLVAPSTMNDAWTRHFADSVQTLALRPQARTWVDIGSGAGFPGLVTAILLAQDGQGRVDLIESAGKKCTFMRDVVRSTALAQTDVSVTVHNARIESALPTLPPCDAISARALASLKDLLTLTEGRLKGDCVGVFAKGRDHVAEIEAARADWIFDCDVTPSRFGDGSVLLTVSEAQRK